MHSYLPQLTLFVAIMFFAKSANGEPLNVGAPMPNVSLVLENGESFKLQEIAGSGYSLIYFYPKADTPGCTAQACSLRDAYETLAEKGISILGVSKDGVESQLKFKEKYQLPFHLIADSDATVIKAFGVPTTFGFSKRQAFLFREGLLVWRDLSASTKQQAEDVLRFLSQELKLKH